MSAQSWQWAALEDVATVTAGNPAPQGEEFFAGGIHPFVRVQDLGRLKYASHLIDTADHVNDKASKSLKLFPRGSILFTKSGASLLLNQRAILGRDMHVVSHIGVAVPGPRITSGWLYYWLRTVDFADIAHGANMPSLPLARVKKINVPVPPLEEQLARVAEIEKQFSRLDEAVANLKRVKANLKRYKAAVLKAAVEGRLTEDWRKAHPRLLLNKEGLWASIDESLKRKKKIDQSRVLKYREAEWFYDCSTNIPMEWEQVRLIDVTRLITCGVAKKPDYVEKGIPFLSAQNCKPFAPNLNDIKYVSETDFQTFTVGGKPEQGDVLYSRVGANFGEACVIPWNFDFAIYVSLTLIKQDRNLLNGRYLVIFLNSLDGVLQSRGGIMGSGIQNLNVDSVRKYRMPITSLEEQNEIVNEVERSFTVARAVEAQVEASLKRAERLRQSVLAQMFNMEPA